MVRGTQSGDGPLPTDLRLDSSVSEGAGDLSVIDNTKADGIRDSTVISSSASTRTVHPAKLHLSIQQCSKLQCGKVDQ